MMKGSRLILKGGRLLFMMLIMTAFGTVSIFAQAVPLPGKSIPQFVDPLPQFSDPVNLRVQARTPGTHLTVEMVPSIQPSLSTGTPVIGPGNVATVVNPLDAVNKPGWTKVWAYRINNNTGTGGPSGNGIFGPLWPGFSIEAQQGVPLSIQYRNLLIGETYASVGLTVDQSIHWANPPNLPMMDPLRMTPYTGPVPAVVHLHGAEVGSESDGGPDQWFYPEGVPALPGGSRTGSGFNPNAYVYPNAQEPATLFYHDHTLGATRLNLYAGLAGFYLLRGTTDDGVVKPGGLPAGKYEIELGIQDRMFDTKGQLYFPSLGINPTLHPFWIPEFFGDVICVNGKSWPYLNVEARRYRFRIVNGSNARFYQLSLDNKNGSAPAVWQIGSDGGLLDVPVNMSKGLLLGTGERADIVIDFSTTPGATLVFKNTAKTPFPNGRTVDPQTTGQVMQFRVGPALAAGTDNSFNPATGLALRAIPVVRLSNPTTGTLGTGVTPIGYRQLTLKEIMGAAGPAEVLVNNSKWMGEMSPNAVILDQDTHTMTGVSELPQVGSTEVWEIVNLTMDAHPIHLHLVQFQLLNRQPFQTNKYLKAYNAAFPGGTAFDPMMNMTMTYPPGVFIPGFGPPLPYNTVILRGTTKVIGGNPDVTPYLQGKPVPPNLNETGWKDTYLMYPGEVTRVVVRWAPQAIAVGGVAGGTNLYPFNPTLGPGYVWHCHIVDHEDNEMMRPQVVRMNPPTAFAVLGKFAQAGTGDAALQASENIPSAYALAQNYPNPFNPTTEIKFALPSDSHVNLTLYNGMGQVVRSVIDRDAPAGYHTVRLDAKALSSGIYFYRLTAGTFTSTRKMILMK